MFGQLQLEIMDRFTAVEQHFRHSPKRQGDIAAQMSKGIVFVQIYAIYEYAIRTATRIGIERIASHAHSFDKLNPSLLAIFLDAEINSVKDSGHATVWDSGMKLFERSVSSDCISGVAVLPHDASHFRHSQLELIFRTLGIKRTVTRLKRHLYAIDEIVNQRNEISHGTATAVEVGRGYSRVEIWRRIALMRAICLRIVEIVSEHCDLPDRHCR